MPDANCKFSADEVVDASKDPRLLEGSSGCEFEEGATILLVGERAPMLPEAAREIPTPPARSEDRTMPTPASQDAAVQQDHAPEASTGADAAPATAAATAPAEPVAQAHTEVPSGPSAEDISKAASSAGDNPMLALGLAALVVVGGGGAMWKFIQQKGKASSELEQKRADQEHELKMKELDLKSKASGADYSATQPPPCQAATVKQEKEISSVSGRVSSAEEELEQLKARIAKLEKKSLSLSSGFDPQEISEMVEKHEKDIKALKAASRER